MVFAARPQDQSDPRKGFGDKVRQLRDEAGHSQATVAKEAVVSRSHIGKIERGETRCDRNIAVTLDRVLGSGNTLENLWDEMLEDAVAPAWFDWYKVESDPGTVVLESYESLVLPGLLQTEDYASVLLKEDLNKIAFRLRRQRVLVRENPAPPRTLFLVAETALSNQVGTPEVMRAQLKHLLSLDSLRITLQVVPHPMPPAGTEGPFCLATKASLTKLAYVDTPVRGFTLSEPDDIHIVSEKLADLRAEALPVGQSRDLITKIMEERWT